MEHLVGLACLSLAPNLRCVGFTLGQFVILIIPPTIEALISTVFIRLYSGPSKWAQVLLVVDTVSYFIWALLDMISHVLPAVRSSLFMFEALDVLVGALSFTPILIYSTYVYRLSFHDFIPILPRILQLYFEISLPMLMVIAMVLNEVSSFVGTRLVTLNGQVVVEFTSTKSLWLSLSQSSLAVYTAIQLLFFLLAFSRLLRAFLDQRRIDLTDSDECHFFHGVAWINAGIALGLAETITGFAPASFSVTLARRILRLVARTTLMFGMLKGLDLAENFQDLVDELRGVSRREKRGSRMLGVDPRQTSVLRRAPQTCSDQSQTNEECSLVEKYADQGRRVTVHCEKGQAPFLQIRFSALEFPARAVLTDGIQERRRSLMGCAGGSDPGHDSLDDMRAVRNAVLGTPRAKSAFIPTGSSHDISDDWMQPPKLGHTRHGSGGTISDNLSVVRDLERQFPSLPPRVTGKYRGSILGQDYEEDPFPVVGVSRQSSMRCGGAAHNPSEDDCVSATLSRGNSIRRKPAPPLLDSIAYISDQRGRPASSWGGLTGNVVNCSPDSPMVPNSPWESTTVYGSDHGLIGEPTPASPKSRRTARDLIRRASRALSDASIRSAEWFASASLPPSTRTPLTAADIEMYRRGSFGPGSTRPKPTASAAEVGPPGENRENWRFAENTMNAHQAGLPPYSAVKVPTRLKPTEPMGPGTEDGSSGYG